MAEATQEFKTIYQRVATQYTGYLKELNEVERYTLERLWAIIRGIRKHGWSIDRLTNVATFLKVSRLECLLVFTLNSTVSGIF